MSDVKLTLEPELETPAGIPTLTLDGVEEEKPVAPEKKEEEQPEVQLTPEEQKVVDDFAEKIDITSSALVMQYGSGAQKKIANFSDTALANVRTKDLGEVGDEIANLVVELKSFDAGEEEKGFLGFFKKQANRLDGMKARYDKAEVNVNKIASSLEGHQVQLMKDIVMLDKLYETNVHSGGQKAPEKRARNDAGRAESKSTALRPAGGCAGGKRLCTAVRQL